MQLIRKNLLTPTPHCPPLTKTIFLLSLLCFFFIQDNPFKAVSHTINYIFRYPPLAPKIILLKFCWPFHLQWLSKKMLNPSLWKNVHKHYRSMKEGSWTILLKAYGFFKKSTLLIFYDKKDILTILTRQKLELVHLDTFSLIIVLLNWEDCKDILYIMFNGHLKCIQVLNWFKMIVNYIK